MSDPHARFDMDALAESGRSVVVSHPRMSGGRGANGTFRISVRRLAPNPLSLRNGLQLGAQNTRAQTARSDSD